MNVRQNVTEQAKKQAYSVWKEWIMNDNEDMLSCLELN